MNARVPGRLIPNALYRNHDPSIDRWFLDQLGSIALGA